MATTVDPSGTDNVHLLTDVSTYSDLRANLQSVPVKYRQILRVVRRHAIDYQVVWQCSSWVFLSVQFPVLASSLETAVIIFGKCGDKGCLQWPDLRTGAYLIGHIRDSVQGT